MCSTHAIRRDKKPRLTWARCRKSAVKSPRTTPGILIRSDGVFYWKANVRTEIPVSLCARDAHHDPLHLGQMDPSAFAMRSRSKRREWDQFRGRQPVDLVGTTRLQLISLHEIQKERTTKIATCCRKLPGIKKNRSIRMIARQLAGSWKITFFLAFFFTTKK